MKKFDIPEIYQSPIISEIKLRRKSEDKLKKDFSPTVLDFGPVTFVIARHFGFCYGVENAIEISYKALEENPDMCKINAKKRVIFLMAIKRWGG